jgi:hypothetical protein
MADVGRLHPLIVGVLCLLFGVANVVRYRLVAQHRALKRAGSWSITAIIATAPPRLPQPSGQ